MAVRKHRKMSLLTELGNFCDGFLQRWRAYGARTTATRLQPSAQCCRVAATLGGECKMKSTLKELKQLRQ